MNLGLKTQSKPKNYKVLYQSKCKYIKKEGASCSLNNNCKYPKCEMDARDKKILDIINWVKSDIAQEENPKICRTATPYRREKLKFLYKLEGLLKK